MPYRVLMKKSGIYQSPLGDFSFETTALPKALSRLFLNLMALQRPWSGAILIQKGATPLPSPNGARLI
ncbi:MAG: hypothetical protein DRR08_32050 [Candidatus Parabeggiatoa sp. nov. 2]|nr:MAG: hypothetical protein DRR08_32050 [Gammaproteobacteria bacterium]